MKTAPKKSHAAENAGTENVDPAALLAAEEAHLSGFFGRIVNFYTRFMQRVLHHPFLLLGSSVVIILLTGLCYHFLETDLLPAMDEGGFILDYFTPPGSSLTESDRILQRMEAILKETPEVENTSRRTGLQLGLAAVTEANRGDFTVRLKAKRKRDIDEIMNDVRDEIKKTEPAADVEFVQVLQDMIGDLSNEPEPVVIKLYSQDPQLLLQTAPKVAEAIGKVPGVVDVLDGVDNTISGPASTFQINSATAARSGFTPEEIAVDASAILEGEPAATPVVLNDRVYPIRVRFPEMNRSSVDQMTNTPLLSATGKTATLGSLATLSTDPGPDRNPPGKSATSDASDCAAGRRGPGLRNCRGTTRGEQSSSSFQHSRRVRRHLPGAAKIFSRPAESFDSRAAAAVHRVAFRVPHFFRASRNSRFRVTFYFRCAIRATDHAHDFQHRVVHGHHHGGRHRG